MKKCGKIYHDGHISVPSETKSEVSLLFKIRFARFIRQTKFRGNGLSNSSEVWVVYMGHPNNAVIWICRKVFVLCFWPLLGICSIGTQLTTDSFVVHYWPISGICNICRLSITLFTDFSQKCNTKLAEFDCELCTNATYAWYWSKVCYKTIRILLRDVFQCYICLILIKSTIQKLFDVFLHCWMPIYLCFVSVLSCVLNVKYAQYWSKVYYKTIGIM